MTTPCGHVYCRGCIEQALKTSTKCPLCKDSVSKRSLVPSATLSALASAYSQLADRFSTEHGGKSVEDMAMDGCAGHLFSGGLDDNEEERRQGSRMEEIDRKIKDVKSAIVDPMVVIEDPSSTADFGISEYRASSMSITTSLLSQEAYELAHRWSTRFKVPLSKDFDRAKTTHVIVDGQPGALAKRTLKYFAALLTGKWIVSPAWLEACLLADKMVSESRFEMSGDDLFADHGPFRARMSLSRQEPPLFGGLLFYSYGAFGTPSDRDLGQLVELGNGQRLEDVAQLARMLKRPRRQQQVVVLCDPLMQSDFEKDSGILQHYKPFVAATWLLDCISAYQLLDLRHYTVI